MRNWAEQTATQTLMRWQSWHCISTQPGRPTHTFLLATIISPAHRVLPALSVCPGYSCNCHRPTHMSVRVWCFRRWASPHNPSTYHQVIETEQGDDMIWGRNLRTCTLGSRVRSTKMRVERLVPRLLWPNQKLGRAGTSWFPRLDLWWC